MASVVIRIVFLISAVVVARGKFLDKLDNSTRPHGHAISVQEIATSITASVQSVMGEQSGEEGRRVGLIEKSIWRTFQALPKNEAGRLAPRGVRYIAHNYFAKEHGWRLAGLDPEIMQANASEVHSASIMQERAPALVESMLEARQFGRGLSFEDVVVMISAIERLIFQESVSLVRSAYLLNGLSATEAIDEENLHEVLRSYLLLYRQGARAALEDYHKHQEDKERLQHAGGAWVALVEYEQDAVLNSVYRNRHTANPFRPRMFSFEDASDIVNSLTNDYGKWQNDDCIAMKEHLMTLAQRGSGRVTLDRFYQPTSTSAFRFHESLEYLRSIGALDESSGLSPQVRIANYVPGPTNCIAQSAYYSVCCLSECHHLMSELEGRVQSPMASPEQLIRLVGGLESATVEAPRRLPTTLIEKLRIIAQRHDGAVPLHGRLFAQWLHFAFPNECPYPQEVSAAALTPSTWLDGKAFAAEEDIQSHLEQVDDIVDSDDFMFHWTDDETLPLHDFVSREIQGFGYIRRMVHCGLRLLPLLLIIRLAWSRWQAIVSAHGNDKCEKDALGYMI